LEDISIYIQKGMGSHIVSHNKAWQVHNVSQLMGYPRIRWVGEREKKRKRQARRGCEEGENWDTHRPS